MKNSSQAFIGATVGVIFMVAILYISLTIECPSDSLAFTTRVILAIAVAAFSMVVSGTLEIKQQGVISAGGSIGVFVLIYMINPASNLQSNKCKEIENLIIDGKVKVNGKILPEVKIEVTQGGALTSNLYKSSEYGHFSHKIIKELFKSDVYYFKFSKNDELLLIVDTLLSTPTNYHLNFDLEISDTSPIFATGTPPKIDSVQQRIVLMEPVLFYSLEGEILLNKNKELKPEKKYYSKNKAFYLKLSDSEGDLSIYNQDDEVAYHFPTQNIHKVKMKSDGNLCFYDSDDKYLWCTSTQDIGYQLKLSDKGILYVEDKTKVAIWKSI